MSGSPWADPSTPTEPGPPYAGPPDTGRPAPPSGYAPYAPGPYPPPYGPPYGVPSPYGPPPYGAPSPYGLPGPWVPGPPPGPRRPGQVVGSAVLAFVQAALVLIASLYVWFAVSLVGFAAEQAGTSATATARALASEGNVLAVLGLLSAGLLVAAGVAGLARRTRPAWLLLLAGHAVQVLLALYWGIRLLAVLGDVPGTISEGAFASFALVFAVAPAVGLGLVLLGPGRAWFDDTTRA